MSKTWVKSIKTVFMFQWHKNPNRLVVLASKKQGQRAHNHLWHFCQRVAFSPASDHHTLQLYHTHCLEIDPRDSAHNVKTQVWNWKWLIINFQCKPKLTLYMLGFPFEPLAQNEGKFKSVSFLNSKPYPFSITVRKCCLLGNTHDSLKRENQSAPWHLCTLCYFRTQFLSVTKCDMEVKALLLTVCVYACVGRSRHALGKSKLALLPGICPDLQHVKKKKSSILFLYSKSSLPPAIKHAKVGILQSSLFGQ